MDYDIQEQIKKWQAKLSYYTDKESVLRTRIQAMEAQRESVNKLPVGSLSVDEFYSKLSKLYTMYLSLPAKKRKCREYITTLKIEI